MNDILQKKRISRLQVDLSHVFFYKADDVRSKYFSITEVTINPSQTIAKVYIQHAFEKEISREKLLQ
jgi:ribosome-binding factor A